MQTLATFCLCFTKVNTKRLPTTKKIFLQLSVWDDKLLSTAKTITFLAESFAKFRSPLPSNSIA